MPADDLAATKRMLRRDARGRSRPDRSGLRDAVVRRLLELPELAGVHTVALYAAIQDEVPVDVAIEALNADGRRTLAPRMAGSELELLEVARGGRWTRGDRGVREPVRAGPVVDPREVGLFVVPGLLFDRACRRLGRGGGHYDRLLARAAVDAWRVGICYADRVVDELPAAPWDVSMHMVVTERGVMRRRSGEEA